MILPKFSVYVNKFTQPAIEEYAKYLGYEYFHGANPEKHKEKYLLFNEQPFKIRISYSYIKEYPSKTLDSFFRLAEEHEVELEYCSVNISPKGIELLYNKENEMLDTFITYKTFDKIYDYIARSFNAFNTLKINDFQVRFLSQEEFKIGCAKFTNKDLELIKEYSKLFTVKV